MASSLEGVLEADKLCSETHMALRSEENLLGKLAQDYAAFMTIDSVKEKQSFNDAVEENLNRLEDFLSTSDMIRSDIGLTLNTTLHQIHAKSKEIEKQFERIDRLEAFVMMAKQNVTELETAVDKAESDLGTVGSIKKALSAFSLPFLSSKPKTPPSPSNSLLRFEPVRIYRTEDYFAPVAVNGCVADKKSISDGGEASTFCPPETEHDTSDDKISNGTVQQNGRQHTGTVNPTASPSSELSKQSLEDSFAKATPGAGKCNQNETDSNATTSTSDILPVTSTTAAVPCTAASSSVPGLVRLQSPDGQATALQSQDKNNCDMKSGNEAEHTGCCAEDCRDVDGNIGNERELQSLTT